MINFSPDEPVPARVVWFGPVCSTRTVPDTYDQGTREATAEHGG